MEELITRNLGGRPTKRDAVVEAKICDALSYGLSNEEAAAYGGICRDTLQDWLRTEEFAERIKGAIAARKLVRLKRIENGDQGWQSCAWLMERSDPARWARPEIMLQLAANTSGKEIVVGPSEASLMKDLALVRKTIGQ